MSAPRTAEQETAWQRARQVVLARDGHRCVDCGVAHDLHVHHLLPRHAGGEDDPGNLITLCAGCHAARHPSLQVSLSQRWMRRWAMRLARWLDSQHELPADMEGFEDALRLLGKERFRDGQMEIVLAAMRGESLLAVRPTGSGKSLCFQLPTLMTPGTAYVISPLKALMADQVSDLQSLKLPGTSISSGISQQEKQLRYQLLHDRALKFLYVTPERFDPASVANSAEIDRLNAIRPSYMVVDEAHCVIRWGNDFRPSYGRLGEVRRQMGNPPVLAFTATASVEGRHQILESLGVPGARVFFDGVDRPNIGLVRHVIQKGQSRTPTIVTLLQKTNGRVMIFVPTVNVGQQAQQELRSAGYDIPLYHAKLPAHQRDRILGDFTGPFDPNRKAVICTNAFGMGIDVDNVRVVIHWMQPQSVEDYLQEIGRAGRDGKPSVALVFKERSKSRRAEGADLGLLDFMVRKFEEESSLPESERFASVRQKYADIRVLDSMLLGTGARGHDACFRRALILHFDPDHYAARPSRSLAMRIFEWLFSSQTPVQTNRLCCDHCSPNQVRALLDTNPTIGLEVLR